MEVDHTEDQAGPATMRVLIAQANAFKNQHDSEKISDREEVIDMKHRTDEAILEDLTALTGGQQVEPTEQERDELRTIEAQRMRSDRDRALQAEVLAKRRREQEILEQARQGALMQAA
ncbi:MAG: hypothetical protein Q9162_006253 [Coniocarpon cinnabarinum]